MDNTTKEKAQDVMCTECLRVIYSIADEHCSK